MFFVVVGFFSEVEKYVYNVAKCNLLNLNIT